LQALRDGCRMTDPDQGRLLPPGTWGFHDLRLGDRVQTAAVTVTAALVDRFADLTGDRFAIHMDDVAARAMGFRARVAHGLLVLSLIDGLKNQAAAQFDAVASLHWSWDFSAPVLVGDRISATLTVQSLRPTKSPGRGIVRLGVRVVNQDGAVVQSGHNLLMVNGSGSL
jgi:3-hydroxybutyryl-CoA dehydratase